MKPIELKSLFVLMGITLGWMSVNFNFELAMIYAVLLFTSYIILKEYPTKFPLEKDENRLIDLVYGIVGFAAYLLGAFAIGLITNTGNTIQSAFSLIEAITPIFANSVFFSILGFGFVVTFIESIMTGQLMGLISRWFKTDLNPKDFKSHIVFGLISLGAVAFHLTTRATLASTGIIKFDPAGLYLTFLFFYITCVGISITKEIIPWCWAHSIANTIAIGQKFGLSFAITIIGILGGGAG